MIPSFLMINLYHSIYIEVITNTYSTLQSRTNEYRSVWTKESKQSSDREGFTPANEKQLLLIPSRDGTGYSVDMDWTRYRVISISTLCPTRYPSSPSSNFLWGRKML
jgi:hypothetical protein